MAALRLCLALFLLGLTTSRVGLVLHELAGHGGAAAAAGCRLTELRLFLFGGGYVGYDCARLTLAPELAIDLGGIALELVVGGLAIALTWRRAGALASCLALAGWLFVLHALFYLVTGVHYGAGDGRTLHGLLGAGRGALVAIGSAGLVAGSFVAATQLAGRTAPWLAASRWGMRAATLAGAALVATALHGGLMRAEQRILADAVYASTFEPEHERAIAARIRQFEERAPRTPAEVVAERRLLAAQAAPFPLTPALGAGMGAAALAGILRATRRREEAGSGALPLGPLALACAGSIALAVALDRLL